MPPPLTALEAVRSGASPSPRFLLLLSPRSSSTDSEAPLVHAIPTECHPASCWEAFVGHKRPGSRHTAQPQLLTHWISLICPPCVTPTPVWILLHVGPHPESTCTRGAHTALSRTAYTPPVWSFSLSHGRGPRGSTAKDTTCSYLKPLPPAQVGPTVQPAPPHPLLPGHKALD